MNQTVPSFFSSLGGKRVAFMGIGVTNTDTIKLFQQQGIRTIACDRRSREELGDAVSQLESMGVELRLGEGYFDDLEADVLFRTPGMYFHLPELNAFREKGGVVTSEMEVFCDLCPCPVIAVTGSEGKTTTSTLIAEMLKAQGKTVHLGGNIGKALLPQIFDIRPEDYAVVELSSFQLISMRPATTVSVVTNVTPNHLDVHGTMEEYTEAKKNIFQHQGAFSRTVLNLDNETTAAFAGEVRGERLFFSLEKPVDHGAYLREDGVLCFVDHGVEESILSREDIRLPGIHNTANYLTAICALRGLVESAAIIKVAREFAGVEHRMEFVRELDGVKWYNDSIGTAPTRVVAGLRSFDQKLILLAGGYDKLIPFEPMAHDVVERVKLLILTGPTAGKIEAAVKGDPDYREGYPAILHAKDLEDAVGKAQAQAKAGDIVALSPACASFDAYPNFAARGKHFKELVRNLDKA